MVVEAITIHGDHEEEPEVVSVEITQITWIHGKIWYFFNSVLIITYYFLKYLNKVMISVLFIIRYETLNNIKFILRVNYYQ